MKAVKLFFVTTGYLLAFCVMLIVFSQVINNIVTGDQIQRFAWFFDVQGIDDSLDLYFDVSMVVSSLLAVIVILLCRMYLRRK